MNIIKNPFSHSDRSAREYFQLIDWSNPEKMKTYQDLKEYICTLQKSKSQLRLKLLRSEGILSTDAQVQQIMLTLEPVIEELATAEAIALIIQTDFSHDRDKGVAYPD